MCAKYALHGSSSTVCNNINYVSNLLHIPKEVLFYRNVNNIISLLCNYKPPSDEAMLASQQILDLLSLRRSGFINFNTTDFNNMLLDIATQ